MRLTKITGSQWVGGMAMDRTRSVIQGVAGIAINANDVKNNSPAMGTRWGAQGISATAKYETPQFHVDGLNLDAASKAYLKANSLTE
jgi:hypothetical protein